MAEHPYLVKLVRDRMGEFLGEGGRVEYRKIGDRGLQVMLLRHKLIEEALEYFKEPSIGEAVDVLQALYDLAELDLQVDRADLEAERVIKFHERGGFLDGVGMYVTTKGSASVEKQREFELEENDPAKMSHGLTPMHGESAEQFIVFRRYVSLGPTRTLRRLSEIVPMGNTGLTRLSAKFRWDVRAKGWDKNTSALARRAMHSEQTQKEET
jgi:predicted house-cleaning noncanonical NTP pyrophosphatase (MazG superfamily)